MPQLKVLLGDKELVSTSVSCGKNVYFGTDQVFDIPSRQQIIDDNYVKFDEPVLDQNYYSYNRDATKMIKGKYIQRSQNPAKPYIMRRIEIDENGNENLIDDHFSTDRLFIKRVKKVGAGKRRTRRTRRINKRRKRSTKRRRH